MSSEEEGKVSFFLWLYWTCVSCSLVASLISHVNFSFCVETSTPKRAENIEIACSMWKLSEPLSPSLPALPYTPSDLMKNKLSHNDDNDKGYGNFFNHGKWNGEIAREACGENQIQLLFSFQFSNLKGRAVYVSRQCESRIAAERKCGKNVKMWILYLLLCSEKETRLFLFRHIFVSLFLRLSTMLMISE